MTGDLNLLKNVKHIKPIEVGLPDGNRTTTSRAGYVQLGPDMVLKGVHFVPKLKCNLISIWQLNKDLNCIVTFTDNFCVIQDTYLEEPDWSG